MHGIRTPAAGIALALVACSAPQSEPAADGQLADASVADAGASPTDARDSDAAPTPTLTDLCGAVPVTLTDWEACFDRRHCAWRVNCAEQNGFVDVQECLELADAVADWQPAAARRERARAVADGRATIDTDAFTQCLVDTSPSNCSTAPHSVACDSRFVGTVPDGGSCYTDIDCSSPAAACARTECTDACCQGVCSPRPALGEACMLRGCAPGLRCSRDTWTCIPGDIGTACAEIGDCDPEAWCDRETGVCRADLPEGAVCTRLQQCGGETSCVGLMRGDQPARCRRLTADGDACDWFCRGNLHCDLSGSAGLGTCRPLPGLGDGCGSQLPCLGANATCSSAQCVERAGDGEPCVDRRSCRAGLFCTEILGDASPVCRAPQGDTQGPCSDPSHCESYVCDGDDNSPGSCQPWIDSCGNGDAP